MKGIVICRKFSPKLETRIRFDDHDSRRAEKITVLFSVAVSEFREVVRGSAD